MVDQLTRADQSDCPISVTQPVRLVSLVSWLNVTNYYVHAMNWSFRPRPQNFSPSTVWKDFVRSTPPPPHRCWKVGTVQEISTNSFTRNCVSVYRWLTKFWRQIIECWNSNLFSSSLSRPKRLSSILWSRLQVYRYQLKERVSRESSFKYNCCYSCQEHVYWMLKSHWWKFC
jgi:hypothetical protein